MFSNRVEAGPGSGAVVVVLKIGPHNDLYSEKVMK
jgi:hypothetical protein